MVLLYQQETPTVFGTGLAKWTDPDDPVLTGISSSWSLICRFLKTAQDHSNSGICFSAHSVFGQTGEDKLSPKSMPGPVERL